MALQSFPIGGLRGAHTAGGRLYHEFLRVPAMSSGLYLLPAGSADPQQPHAEDEVYVVLSGRGRFTCEGETVAVEPGQTIYVPARDAHRFHDIVEDLAIIVVFAPAEAE
ncbi:MAG: cupin domain-containing protein [Thermomicrobiales bacterium]